MIVPIMPINTVHLFIKSLHGKVIRRCRPFRLCGMILLLEQHLCFRRGGFLNVLQFIFNGKLHLAHPRDPVRLLVVVFCEDWKRSSIVRRFDSFTNHGVRMELLVKFPFNILFSIKTKTKKQNQ